jgi:hypothetical protein
MAKKARKAQRRRRQRRLRGRALEPLDQMHQALGEFLTAQGRVELSMLLLVMLIRDEDYEWLFDQYSIKTFGPKIDWFKEWTSNPEAFSSENQLILNQVYKNLIELLPKRNSLIHGETYQEEFKGRPKQPYRVGVIKKNIQYLEEFSRAGGQRV